MDTPTFSTVATTDACDEPHWDADRAHTVAAGLDRLAERGYMSERQRRQLAARVEALASGDAPGPRQVSTANTPQAV